MTKPKNPGGRPKLHPRQATKQQTVYFPSKQYRELKREAIKRGISFNALVRERCQS